MTPKKPTLTIEDVPQKKPARADLYPVEGFVMVVDGHFKTSFDTQKNAEAGGHELKTRYPMLQIEIYDAATRLRSPLV